MNYPAPANTPVLPHPRTENVKQILLRTKRTVPLFLLVGFRDKL